MHVAYRGSKCPEQPGLRDENGVMELDAPEGEGAVEAMEKLAETYPSLKGIIPGQNVCWSRKCFPFRGLPEFICLLR